MAVATLALVMLLVAIIWRVGVTDLEREPLRQIASARHHHNSLLGRRFWMAVIAGNRFENGADRIALVHPEDRAEIYLRRIAAVTGATQKGNCYVLNVGEIRFYVQNRYVRRMLSGAGPTAECGETCFYPSQQDMPVAERIATALLQLKNNPALFDKWALQGPLFKADGELFESRRTN